MMMHFVFTDDPKPAPRPRARIVPTCSTGALLARAKRARVARDVISLFRTQVYSPADIERWKREAERELQRVKALEFGPGPIVPKGEPIEVYVLAVFALPKDAHRKRSPVERTWHAKNGGGDWDNLGKPVCDAANGVLWHDDSQIARAMVEKVVGAQGERPRLELLVRPLDDHAHATMFERLRDGTAPPAALFSLEA